MSHFSREKPGAAQEKLYVFDLGHSNGLYEKTYRIGPAVWKIPVAGFQNPPQNGSSMRESTSF
jgi:hypothetical protein